ncbi:hypothetical protein pah_c050o035 [Parachlamydia acanthamoebae str. Hall's coccus]|nr:hypothetical protein pah_c050o035 [Parachlamydia acanthamoebae str. Hall's coccus]
MKPWKNVHGCSLKSNEEFTSSGFFKMIDEISTIEDACFFIA